MHSIEYNFLVLFPFIKCQLSYIFSHILLKIWNNSSELRPDSPLLQMAGKRAEGRWQGGCLDKVGALARCEGRVCAGLPGHSFLSPSACQLGLHLSCSGVRVYCELAFVIHRELQELSYLQKLANYILHLLNTMTSTFRLGRNWN